MCFLIMIEPSAAAGGFFVVVLELLNVIGGMNYIYQLLNLSLIF